MNPPKLKPLRVRLWIRLVRTFNIAVNACGICTGCYVRRHHGEWCCARCYHDYHRDEK